jgi:hypothetical protein
MSPRQEETNINNYVNMKIITSEDGSFVSITKDDGTVVAEFKSTITTVVTETIEQTNPVVVTQG